MEERSEQGFELVKIDNTGDNPRMREVWRRTYTDYLGSGYCSANSLRMLRHYRDLDCIAETSVFGTYANGRLIGTNSLTLDKKGLVLPGDYVFPDFLNEIRKECESEGKILGVSWRLVTAPEYRCRTKIVSGLINRTIEEIKEIGLDVLLCSVNPRHEGFYNHRCGFEKIAGPKKESSVENAEAVLLRVDSDVLFQVWGEGYKRNGRHKRNRR